MLAWAQSGRIYECVTTSLNLQSWESVQEVTVDESGTAQIEVEANAASVQFYRLTTGPQ